jgi:lysine 2,3-aminomutase
LITSIEELPSGLASSVSPEERVYIDELRKGGALPFAVTPHYASLARPERDDPIRRQFFPDPREALADPFALDDPLGEACYRAAPRLVHQYRDRALLLAGGACAGYCRYCFRRVWLGKAPAFIGNTAFSDTAFTGGPAGGAAPTAASGELAPALAYIRAHSEIREILVSGGDPLSAADRRLEELFMALREARPDALLRVCTRAPLTMPARLGDETIALFRRFLPLRLLVHINHPRELGEPVSDAGRGPVSPDAGLPGRDASVRNVFVRNAPARRVPSAGERLAACVKAGIPVHVQTVLLRGVNDDPAVLAELFRECLNIGLTPYYLFQLDLAPGTAHFRVPLKQGLAIYREQGALISGLGLPAYAVDLPGGGGKIRLHDNVIAGEKTTPAGIVYLLKDAAGRTWEYPAE